MSNKTGISWTNATWNPIRGCSRVSEGCRNCYAERVAARFSGAGMPYEGMIKHVDKRQIQMRDGEPTGVFRTVTEGRWNGIVRMVPEHLADPLRWRKPRRIFVNSMSDLFHESLTNEQIAAVFGVMAAAPQHTFQVLTKRAKRMREWFAWFVRECSMLDEEPLDSARVVLADAAGCELGDGSDADRDRSTAMIQNAIEDGHARDGADGGTVISMPWPLPNVWIGVSVENQAAADERIPELLATPAAVRFLSCEPLIGPVEIKAGLGQYIDAKGNWRTGDGVTWVIAGCESGPGARPCDVAWLRSLRDQCGAAGVPFFLKQAQYTVEVGRPLERTLLAVHEGQGSKRKSGGVIELPYLDGVQHAAFPEVTHG